MLFPVPASTTVSYDEPFVEAIDYADGFTKIVHTAQQRVADPYAEVEDGTRPARETGIRLGWDDEQVAIWINRQVQVLGPTDPDTTMGVAGYRIDVREHGTAAWHSLCAAAGPVTVGATNLGNFAGELPVETAPVQLNAQATGEYWLGAYFTRWVGGAVIGGDPIGMRLSGAPAPAAAGSPRPTRASRSPTELPTTSASGSPTTAAAAQPALTRRSCRAWHRPGRRRSGGGCGPVARASSSPRHPTPPKCA